MVALALAAVAVAGVALSVHAPLPPRAALHGRLACLGGMACRCRGRSSPEAQEETQSRRQPACWAD